MRGGNITKLYFPKLSYKIVGILYEIYNNLGFGYQEKYYQRAFEIELQKEKIPYSKELPVKLDYKKQAIGKYFIDFVIKNKMALEFKIADDFYQRDVNQLLGYLKTRNLKLGILVLFSKEGLKYKRIVN